MTDICFDKTGTLTQAKMTVVRGITADDNSPFEVSKRANNEGKTVDSSFVKGERETRLKRLSETELLAKERGPSDECLSAFDHLLLASLLCKSTTASEGNDDVDRKSDPTEAALETFAEKAGLTRDSALLKVKKPAVVLP